jgi:hypothetical protein
MWQAPPAGKLAGPLRLERVARSHDFATQLKATAILRLWQGMHAVDEVAKFIGFLDTRFAFQQTRQVDGGGVCVFPVFKSAHIDNPITKLMAPTTDVGRKQITAKRGMRRIMVKPPTER